MNIIEIKNLSVGYASSGRIILKNLNLSVATSEIVALIGSNGSGKSSLLKTLSLHNKAISGDIFLSGQNINSYKPIEKARRISYVSTELIRTGNLTVFDLVSLGRFPHTLSTGRLYKTDIDIVNSALDIVGMSDFAERKISEISDGENQKIMIARAVAQDTNCILLDEPTAFLDIENKLRFIEILKKIVKTGKSVIYSTHELRNALKTSDKIWLISEDKIKEGAPEDIITAGKISNFSKSDSFCFDIDTYNFETQFETDYFVNPVNKTDNEMIFKLCLKALERLGIKTSEKSGFRIEVCNKNNDFVLKFYSENSEKSFNSIYELSCFLKSFFLQDKKIDNL